MAKINRNVDPQSPVVATAAPVIGDTLGPEYINRELSWLEFNRRVLHEAADPRTPLLERLNFLSIFTSNLDEFIMKRVGLLKRQVSAGVLPRRPDGMTAAQQLTAVRQLLIPMLDEQARIFRELLPALAGHGIRILSYEDLDDSLRKQAIAYFHTRVFPVLTPLAVDPGHPFPFISNLSTSLSVTLHHPKKREKLFTRVKVPEVLPQFVRLQTAVPNEYVFVSLLDLIRHNLQDLFPGMRVANVMAFRVTRNADVERDEEEAEDLLDLIEQEVRQRRFEHVVRLELGPAPDPWMLRFLIDELELTEQDVYEMPGLLDYTILKSIAELPLPQLRYEPHVPVAPKVLADAEANIFSVIRGGDVLVHHPYESFNSSVENFVRLAADDPNVLAIKITLYRTGAESPFIPALIRAAESGKQVVAIIELKARFDEQRNIHVAQALEAAGVHVVYGMVGYKTHTKATLVVRQEPDGPRCYCHIGTGNYHVQTAKLYTDFSLLTCRQDICEDMVELFHFLTGRSLKRDYRKLLVAPVNMRERFSALIETEIANRQAGKPARIVAKMNSLEDYNICQSLYRASQAGVPIDLLVRGFCTLRPGVKGLSENIRVVSIIGRFLEHSRIFHFAAGQENPLSGQFFIGSADWMYRNLQTRIELICPIEDHAAKARLWETLTIMLADRRQAWDMQPDGSYIQRQVSPDTPEIQSIGTHKVLIELARKNLLK